MSAERIPDTSAPESVPSILNDAARLSFEALQKYQAVLGGTMHPEARWEGSQHFGGVHVEGNDRKQFKGADNVDAWIAAELKGKIHRLPELQLAWSSLALERGPKAGLDFAKIAKGIAEFALIEASGTALLISALKEPLDEAQVVQLHILAGSWENKALKEAALRKRGEEVHPNDESIPWLQKQIGKILSKDIPISIT